MKFLLAVVLLALAPNLLFANPPQPPTTYAGVHPDKSLRRLAPAGGYLVDEQVWGKLWQAWQPKEKVPTVNFRESFVLVATVDGMNRMMGSPQIDDNGDVKFQAASTRMAGPGFGYLMAVFPREGVKTINGKPFAPGPQAAATGTLTIPSEVPSFKDHTLEVRLYKIHPQLADAPADLVKKTEVKRFAHAQGKETTTHFIVGASEKLDPKLMYYLTVFVLKDGQRTHIGETKEKNLCRVLTQGRQADAALTLRPVRER